MAIIKFWIILIFLLSSAFSAAVEAAMNYRVYYSANDGSPNWRILSAQVSDDKSETPRQLAIDIGSAGSLDSAQAFGQSVVKEENGTYTMWYGGNDGRNWRILRATSINGINWVKQGLALSLGNSNEFDSTQMAYPYIIKDDKTYKMWYTAYDGSSRWRIGYAESLDGVIFRERKMALDVGQAGALDAEHVHTPVVLKQGGIYTMYYAGFGGSPVAWRILRATSADGVNWIKQGLCLDLGNAGSLDNKNLLAGSVRYENGIWTLYYWGHGDIWKAFSAASKNGIDWEKRGVFLDVGPVRSLDFRGLAVPAVLEEK